MSVRCMAHVLRSARTQRVVTSVFALKVFFLLVSRMGQSVLPKVRAHQSHTGDKFFEIIPSIEDIKCTSNSEQETHQFCSCQTTFASVVSISPLRSTQTMWTTLSTSKPWTTYGILRDKDSVRNLLPIES